MDDERQAEERRVEDEQRLAHFSGRVDRDVPDQEASPEQEEGELVDLDAGPHSISYRWDRLFPPDDDPATDAIGPEAEEEAAGCECAPAVTDARLVRPLDDPA